MNYYYKKIQTKKLDSIKPLFNFAFRGIPNQKGKNLLSPVYLKKNNKDENSNDLFSLIYGNDEINYALEKNISEIGCFIYSEPDIKLFIISVTLYNEKHSLNIVEKAKIINILKNHFELEQTKILDIFFPIINENTSKKRIKDYLKLLDYPFELLKYIVRENINLKTALLFHQLTSEQRIFFVDFLSKLRMGANRIKFFIKLFDLMNEKKIFSFLKDKKVLSILNNDDINLTQKNEIISDILFKTAYPEYSKELENYKKFIKNLNLSSNIKIIEPLHFEGDEYKIEFSFKNISDFRKVLEKLNNIHNEEIEKLLSF